MAQNQQKADSIKEILESNLFSDTVSLVNLKKLSRFSSSPDDKLESANRLKKLAESLGSFQYFVDALILKGVAFRLMGDLEHSLENLFEAAELSQEYSFNNLLIESYSEIGSTYARSNVKTSLLYQKLAIQMLRKSEQSQVLAISLLNIGYVYYSINEYDSAELYYDEAEPIFEEINLAIGKAYTVGNRALVYWKQGDLETAKHDLLKAIEMLKPLGDQYGMADYHNQLGNIHIEQGNIEKTIWHTEQAIQMGEALGLKEQIRDASLLLSELYTQKKKYQTALKYQTQYLSYKDSIENTEQTKKMADLRTEFEVNLREKEIDVLEKGQILQRTYIIIAVILLILSMVILLYFRQRFKTTKLMAGVAQKQQRDKIKDLLGSQETKALQAMVKGRDGERRRLAQELHNHFGSLLATVKVNLNGMEDVDSPKHQTITTLVDQACTDIRNMSHSLNMGISENFGLVPALKELTAHLQQAGGLEVEFAASMGEYQLDSENEIIIYRIVQELVSNVLKHAEATKLSISLTCFEEENLVNIIVEDNGKGFDKEIATKESDGMGLGSIKEMVVGFQGDIIFDSNFDRGTTVNIDLPLTQETNLAIL